jgi:hypothetical protein
MADFFAQLAAPFFAMVDFALDSPAAAAMSASVLLVGLALLFGLT